MLFLSRARTHTLSLVHQHSFSLYALHLSHIKSYTQIQFKVYLFKPIYYFCVVVSLFILLLLLNLIYMQHDISLKQSEDSFYELHYFLTVNPFFSFVVVSFTHFSIPMSFSFACAHIRFHVWYNVDVCVFVYCVSLFTLLSLDLFGVSCRLEVKHLFSKTNVKGYKSLSIRSIVFGFGCASHTE